MMKLAGKKKNKNIPYFSHEFFITNHGDIVGVVAIIIVMGLMSKLTSPLSQAFVVFQPKSFSNDTDSAKNNNNSSLYVMEKSDILKIFFYTLTMIIGHETLQESVLDKLNKKLHLSKTKFVKFNESGQLAVFYIFSLVWFFTTFYNERHIQHLNDLWEGYPHSEYSFSLKVFFILQICYWIHQFPELYFRRLKRDELNPVIFYATMNLVVFSGAYCLNMTRIASCLMVIHYIVELFFHLTRIIHFIGKISISLQLFHVWNVLFVTARMMTATLSYLTFQYGFSKNTIDTINVAQGNFNTKMIRLNIFLFVIVVQVYMMWNFINFHMKRIRENSSSGSSGKSRVTYVTNTDLQRMRKGKKKVDLDNGEDDNVSGGVKHRKM